MTSLLKRVPGRITGELIMFFARALTGVRPIWRGSLPTPARRVYFANHGSHGDFVLIWTTLPAPLRHATRPVAGQDYWLASALRRFIGRDVFNALLIDRQPQPGAPSPVDLMADALSRGESLILFPEGTRNTGEEVLLPLKSGIYHLARSFGHVRFVPVWIENLKRVLPKGALLPVPLACSVRFGEPLTLIPQEDKQRFLQRARQALLDLRPEYDREADPAPSALPPEPAGRDPQTPGSGA